MSKSQESANHNTFDLVHDLRAPLTAIHGFATAMLDGTVPTEDFPKYLAFIQGESERLGGIVSRLLTAEKLSAKKLAPSVFNLAEALRLTLIGMEKTVEDKRLRVDFAGEELCVEADRGLLTEALYNLLENAVKYSPVGGSLGILIKEKDGAVHVSIRNAAPDLKADELPLLFGRYYRGDTEEKGTGLGLYIAKEILALHSSILKAEKDGEDIVFFFALPIAK